MQQTGHSRQRPPHIRIIPFEGRKQDQPDAVSQDVAILIRWVFPPPRADLFEVGENLGPRRLEQRPDDADPFALPHGWNPRQPVQAAPAQQSEEDGLRLIVERVPRGDGRGSDLFRDARQESVPEAAPGILQGEPLARGEGPGIRRFGVMGQTERLAQRRDERRILRCAPPQPVVEVGDVERRAHFAAERNHGVDKGRRVGASGHGDHDRLSTGQHGVSPNRLPDAVHERQPGFKGHRLAAGRTAHVTRARWITLG